MVLSSLSEGGAHVISEAIVEQVPILASRIPGNTGLLGNDYPGLFETGNAKELADLIQLAESKPEFLNRLHESVKQLSPLFLPGHELESWKNLLDELT